MTGPGRLAVTVTTSSPPPREPCRCTAWTLDGHRRSPPTTAVASRAAMREQRNALRSGREADLPSARSYALPPPPARPSPPGELGQTGCADTGRPRPPGRGCRRALGQPSLVRHDALARTAWGAAPERDVAVRQDGGADGQGSCRRGHAGDKMDGRRGGPGGGQLRDQPRHGDAR